MLSWSIFKLLPLLNIAIVGPSCSPLVSIYCGYLVYVGLPTSGWPKSKIATLLCSPIQVSPLLFNNTESSLYSTIGSSKANSLIFSGISEYFIFPS